jgi:endo-1,4-beta-xylanase
MELSLYFLYAFFYKKNMNKRVFKAVIIVFIIVGSGFGTFIYYKYYKPAIYNIELPHGLCVNASLPIGVATDSYRLKNNQIYRERVLSNFNLIVGEWEMKWGELENESGQYDFTRSDYLVEFAEANGMKIHGHTLIWHGDIPSRIENFNGTPAQLEQAMKEHIQTVVTRYKGRIQTWDVVNEAFDWIKENKSYGYRNTIFYRMLGKDYIAKAYQWAHEADPDAKLYYNDYELIDNPEKAR